MGLRAARLGGGEPTPADGVTTKAAAREDNDFADFALQESTGEALSVDRDMAKAVARSRKVPVRRPWSKDDVRLLKRMARKEPAAKIAKALKRTEGATRQKATGVGISLSMTRKKRTSAKER